MRPTISKRIYFPFFPYPPQDGAARVVFEQLLALSPAEQAQTELVIWKDTLAQANAKQSMPYPIGWPDAIRVVSLAHESSLDATIFSRLKRVIFGIMGCFVSPELYYYPPALRERAREHAEGSPAQIGIYHYGFCYPWIWKKPALERMQHVIFHNLEDELFVIRAQLTRGLTRLTAPLLLLIAWRLTRHEKRLGLDALRTLYFLSPLDLKRYRERAQPIATTRIFPLSLTPSSSNSFSKASSDRVEQSRAVRAGFVGNLGFGPNQLSALWIARELCPALEASRFQGLIEIVGRDCPPWLRRELERYPFVNVLGFVDDLDALMARWDWVLVPDVGGSGIRIKLLEALAEGIPCLTTPLSLERIGLNDAPSLIVESDPLKWAETLLVRKGAPA